MSSENFKNWAEGIQAIALTIAIAVGGGWTLYRYNQSQELNLTRLEYENILEEDKVKPIVNISIEVSEISDEYLHSVATLENIGSKDVNLILNESLDGSPVKPWKLGAYKSDDTYDYVAESDVHLVENANTPSGQTEAIGNLYLKAGATYKLNWIYPRPKPGIYLIEFRGIPSEFKKIESSKKNVAHNETYFFYGQQIVTIGYN